MGLLQESEPPKHDNPNHPSIRSHIRREQAAQDHLDEYNIPSHMRSRQNRSSSDSKQPKAPG